MSLIWQSKPDFILFIFGDTSLSSTKTLYRRMNWDFSTQSIQARLEQAAKLGQNVVSNLAEQAAAVNQPTSAKASSQPQFQQGTLIDIDQSSSSSSVNISNAELERFKKMESRFVGRSCGNGVSFMVLPYSSPSVDLARAYKAIKSKQDQMESIITENSSIKELKLPEHFTDLERLVKASSQSFDSEREITKLVNQINELKHSNEQEASTNADMYSAMQAKLINREEVI